MSDDKVTRSVAEAIAAQSASPALPKRFYKTVSVVAGQGADGTNSTGDTASTGAASSTAGTDGASSSADSTDIGGAHYLVQLDGRKLRTPGKVELAFPGRALADAVADEWQAQETQIDLSIMPLSRLAYRALDVVRGYERETRAQIVDFAGSDLLCYRADNPKELVERQATLWNPVLAWAKQTHAIDLTIATGVTPVRQSPAALAALNNEIAARYNDAYTLACLHVLTTLCGSALLAFAHGEGLLTRDETWAAAYVDEDWQIERWGVDEEAQRARQARKMDMDAASAMLALIRG